ncbi:hypothetical protein AZA_40855 [Nitrospirillum viridazoti Y2]|nr:hypothetical protein AZA_40855 [Nitrospirillum amazonense Y2]
MIKDEGGQASSTDVPGAREELVDRWLHSRTKEISSQVGHCRISHRLGQQP